MSSDPLLASEDDSSARDRRNQQRISLPRTPVRDESDGSSVAVNPFDRQGKGSEFDAGISDFDEDSRLRQIVNLSWPGGDEGPLTPRFVGFAKSVRLERGYTSRAWFWICLSVRATKYRKVATFWPSRLFELFISVVICTNIAIAIWAISESTESERDFHHRPTFWALDIVSIVAFLMEYLLRLWACVEDVSLRKRSPCVARLLWAVKPLSLLDLSCLLLVSANVPFYLSSVDSVTVDRSMLELRVLMIMRFERQLKALGRLKVIIGSEVRELALAGFFTICLTVYCGVIFYFVEKAEDADMEMGTAIWWGVQTITSLGYGTVLPKTVVGKILSGVLALLGLIAFAIPAGIISSRFTLIAADERMHDEVEGIDDEVEENGDGTDASIVQSGGDRRKRRGRRRSSSPGRSRSRQSYVPCDEEDFEVLRREVETLRAKVRVLSGLLLRIETKETENAAGTSEKNASKS
eukprot:g2824.t1